MSGSEWQKFKNHLARQLRFIERSCEAYDQGYTDEAIRIATQIRVIVNPGGKKSRSLLQHLNSGRIPLLSTSEGASDRSDLSMVVGLGSFRFSSDGQTATGKYYPGLDNALHREYIKADRWWKQVTLVMEGTRYSREAIVRDTANKDGGAHVAATLTPEYERLTTPGVIGDLVEVSGGVETRTPISDIHFVCIRQMAYELLNSPELLKLAGYSPRPQMGGGTRGTGDEGGEDAQGEPEVQDKPEVHSEADVHSEPEVQRPPPAGVRLTNEDLERIREEVIQYFRAYHSELRNEIEKHPSSVPEYIQGQKHILFEFGNDGIVITHRRNQGNEDTFEFNIVQNTPVKDLVAAKALKTPKGATKSVHLDYNFGEDFGENTYLGPLVQQEGDLYYHTDWVQLDYASWVHLDRWRDEAHARKEERQDFQFRFSSGEVSTV
jgi:hypothetical protein